ncbi:MAG: OmpA family protein [Bdellovibrionales bacterium]|nr:OmpA family protein [Bdellovibrionales bacterium]
MSKAAKQSPIAYLGLFVAFFALYAREHQKILKAGHAEPVKEAPVPLPVMASQKIQDLSKTFQEDSLFQVRADGLRADYRLESVDVAFYGDEVYGEGAFAIRETWYTAMDRLAELIKPYLKRGLKIEVIGYTDIGSLKERRPSDYGESDYALSFARAEWVARFLERRALIPIKERVKITGAGAVKAGRKVEFRFTFDKG